MAKKKGVMKRSPSKTAPARKSGPDHKERVEAAAQADTMKFFPGEKIKMQLCNWSPLRTWTTWRASRRSPP